MKFNCTYSFCAIVDLLNLSFKSYKLTKLTGISKVYHATYVDSKFAVNDEYTNLANASNVLAINGQNKLSELINKGLIFCTNPFETLLSITVQSVNIHSNTTISERKNMVSSIQTYYDTISGGNCFITSNTELTSKLSLKNNVPIWAKQYKKSIK